MSGFSLHFYLFAAASPPGFCVCSITPYNSLSGFQQPQKLQFNGLTWILTPYANIASNTPSVTPSSTTSMTPKPSQVRPQRIQQQNEALLFFSKSEMFTSLAPPIILRHMNPKACTEFLAVISMEENFGKFFSTHLADLVWTVNLCERSFASTLFSHSIALRPRKDRFTWSTPQKLNLTRHLVCAKLLASHQGSTSSLAPFISKSSTGSVLGLAETIA